METFKRYDEFMNENSNKILFFNIGPDLDNSSKFSELKKEYIKLFNAEMKRWKGKKINTLTFSFDDSKSNYEYAKKGLDIIEKDWNRDVSSYIETFDISSSVADSFFRHRENNKTDW